jgi:class 3 adenylate cyclase
MGGFYALRRYKDTMQRRMQGMKKEGEVAVVVTDIEGYSSGWRRLTGLTG